jgi:hypothetical protein
MMVFIVGFVFLGVMWLWNVVDFIVAVVGSFKDSNGKVIANW